MLAQFADIGVGPGQDLAKLDDATRPRCRGWPQAATECRGLGYSRTYKNGWGIPPSHLGRLGLHDELLSRAAIQSLGGIVANEVEEASYISARNDAAGQPLDGSSKRYVVHFAPGEQPQVNAFWSMSIYDMTFNFSANPIDRFSIGERTPGLVKDADGGLTLYLQADDPGADKHANWLPIPRARFYTTFRSYIPGEAIRQGQWSPPPVQAIP